MSEPHPIDDAPASPDVAARQGAEQAAIKSVVEDEALWEVFESSLSPASRARIKRANAAVEEHGGHISALD